MAFVIVLGLWAVPGLRTLSVDLQTYALRLDFVFAFNFVSWLCKLEFIGTLRFLRVGSGEI